jgi:DNA-directed RNA polymerase subunit L
MKLEVITNESDSIEFFIEGERHTLPNLLREKLSSKTEVDFIAYRLDHPLDKRARFVLKAKNAKKVLEQAIKEIQEDLKEFESAFEKIK